MKYTWRVFVVVLGLTVFSSTQAFSQGGTWTTRAPMPTARTPALGVVKGIVYAVGGTNGSGGVYSTLEAYNPATDSWATLAPMLTARGHLAAAGVNGILYALGGCSDNACSSYLATVEAYDPVTNSWSTKTAMPTARRDFAAGVINGILYVVSGDQGPGSPPISAVEAYDPSTNTWTTKAPIPTPRAGPSVGVVNGILYAIGGYNDGPPSYTANEAYDPNSNAWTEKAPLPATGQTTGAADAISGIVYLLTSLHLEAYNPATDSWSAQTPLPDLNPRGSFVAAANGVLYAVGGGTSSGLVSTNEAFFPPVAIDIKPGEDPPSINPKSHGRIPVAILSSSTFDATTQVDRTSLTFGRTGDEQSLAFCSSGGQAVNGDGLPDLVCHFDTQETGFQAGDTVGVLKGKTLNNILLIQGADAVRIVP